jgi:hypothetical protein
MAFETKLNFAMNCYKIAKTNNFQNNAFLFVTQCKNEDIKIKLFDVEFTANEMKTLTSNSPKETKPIFHI